MSTAETTRPIVIGIAGGSGSGKTTVALRVADHFENRKVVILHHDSYYRDRSDLPLEDRRRLNYDHPDSFENELVVEHLVALRTGEAIPRPTYNYESHCREEKPVSVGPAHIILLEGILVLDIPEIRELLDIKLYVDCAADERLTRRILRDLHERGRSVHSVLNQYTDTVRPMHLQFVEPSKRHADVIIPRGGFNEVAIDLIVSRMREILTRLSEVEVER
ncbi:MAG: uridine kinase [Gemmatimonadota bacterium]|jgi:uridine kinase|nr:uridine kinase [Gemmatimonadota bacterium]MDP6529112.1 uridine kinase [Gemmatimonadota bacterium]MDP6802726.1 uridine kinase [Gemmatimonadota bacterium]MDP7031753.1 uridine kinase [Gemmatimonadota bacterium]